MATNFEEKQLAIDPKDVPEIQALLEKGFEVRSIWAEWVESENEEGITEEKPMMFLRLTKGAA